MRTGTKDWSWSPVQFHGEWWYWARAVVHTQLPPLLHCHTPSLLSPHATVVIAMPLAIIIVPLRPLPSLLLCHVPSPLLPCCSCQHCRNPSPCCWVLWYLYPSCHLAMSLHHLVAPLGVATPCHCPCAIVWLLHISIVPLLHWASHAIIACLLW